MGVAVTPITSANPEVIELLEAYLEVARKSPRWGHIAIAMTGHPGVAALDFAGEISLEESTQEALEKLKGKIDASIANWTLPPRNEYFDASYVVFNVANGPLGFDFLVWLIDAEMTRIREKAAGPLVVAFFMGRDGVVRTDRNTPQRMAWLTNVMRPALKLIGAKEDTVALYGRNKPVFVTRDICSAARAGEAVPRFRAPPTDNPLDLPDDYVSITLREAKHWPHRNSKLDEWLKFANHLKAQGQTVVFVRDTAKADDPIDGFLTCPEASRNLLRRMEVYDRARANLFVNNGPVVLAVFGTKPFLEFVRLEPEGSVYAPDQPIFWAKHHGVPVGEQYPWSAPDQRLVWANDTFENILEAWDAHIAPGLAAAA